MAGQRKGRRPLPHAVPPAAAGGYEWRRRAGLHLDNSGHGPGRLQALPSPTLTLISCDMLLRPAEQALRAQRRQPRACERGWQCDSRCGMPEGAAGGQSKPGRPERGDDGVARPGCGLCGLLKASMGLMRGFEAADRPGSLPELPCTAPLYLAWPAALMAWALHACLDLTGAAPLHKSATALASHHGEPHRLRGEHRRRRVRHSDECLLHHRTGGLR